MLSTGLYISQTNSNEYNKNIHLYIAKMRQTFSKITKPCCLYYHFKIHDTNNLDGLIAYIGFLQQQFHSINNTPWQTGVSKQRAYIAYLLTKCRKIQIKTNHKSPAAFTSLPLDNSQQCIITISLAHLLIQYT